MACAIGSVGREALALETKSCPGALQHGGGGTHLVGGTRRRRFDIVNDRVLVVDDIVQPIADLEALVGLGRAGGGWIGQ